MAKYKNFKYSWFRDKKMIGTIVLIFAAIIQTFAFLKVPVISSIHSYTFGMLVGFYNPLVYSYIAYVGLLMIFGSKVKLPKWVKFNRTSYWFLVISIIFIGVSSSYYQIKTKSFTDIGLKPWKSFNLWFKDFTRSTAWAPTNTNGGVLGAFLYSFFAMICSGIGSLIISIFLLVIVISFIATGTFFDLYKQVKVKRNLDLKQKEITSSNEIPFDNYTDDSTLENNMEPISFSKKEIEVTKEKVSKPSDEDKLKNHSEDLPFDDSF